uniref:Beta-ketoacyl-[acyl-carrier-protein] synthase III n=1 Tax=Dichotomaria marginata TaxID=268567 RepID=A0A1G4NS40_9FLOR|nr:Beta-ketoacyl-acyl carrier protein synthase III [Dichotomaria marginata]SCW21473.1 Beta-ketoacyl-acyl carrier protein synthase III [Dichotomaria marginata]
MIGYNTLGVHILSTGSAVPDLSITNETLSTLVNTSDKWISTRTGIKERRVLPKEQSIIDLAKNASLEAINRGLLEPNDLDLIILATSSQNDLFGSASQLQAAIGANHAAAFDLTAACSGFIISLITASQFIQTGSYKNILVVGADILSRWVDWSDRSTCILFGDGAGAAIVQKNYKNDLLSFKLNTKGSQANQLSILYKINKQNIKIHKSIPFMHGQYEYLKMNGKEVYKFAVSQVPQSIQECLKLANLSTNDISWLILHQANQRILEAVAEKLSIPQDKMISNISKYGNTSAASIPIALHEVFKQGKICNGDIVVIAGFGAGLTWGTTIIQWNALE